MKAIFIPTYTFTEESLIKLNEELKDVYSIKFDIDVNPDYGGGKLLIVKNFTRKDKLKKLNEISNEEGTSDNSVQN
jgi:hypothetical protein